MKLNKSAYEKNYMYFNLFLLIIMLSLFETEEV